MRTGNRFDRDIKIYRYIMLLSLWVYEGVVADQCVA